MTKANSLNHHEPLKMLPRMFVIFGNTKLHGTRFLSGGTFACHPLSAGMPNYDAFFRWLS
jgi:hypothetical protein